METLLDKSMRQTDEVVKIARQAIAEMDRLREKVIELEAERDRLREINKELVEALKMIRSKDISLLDKNVINNLIFKADTA